MYCYKSTSLESNNMKTCKICDIILKNKKQIYCSNNCKFNDGELNKKRVSVNKNDPLKRINCKLCGWKSKDCLNKSGILTEHVLKHPNETSDSIFVIESVPIVPMLNCVLCDWKTKDINNKSGCFTNHIKTKHNLTIELFLEKYNDQYNPDLFKTNKQKIKRSAYLQENEKNRIECKICNKLFKKLSHTHLKHHNITPDKYKQKFNVSSTCSESTTNIQKTKSINSQFQGILDRITEYNCIPLFSEKQYDGVDNNKKYKFKCNVCINKFLSTLDDGKGPICKICNPSLLFKPNKKAENELYEFLNSFLPNKIVCNDRTTIAPLELDFYAPSKNIAIEYNGLYWHSEYYKDKKYHLNKNQLCEQKNIHLIQIFEDEWHNKKELIKAKLKHILKENNTERIYARKCIIKEIDFSTAKTFLEKNHIQGNDTSTYKYGLFSANELVAVMTFSKPRIALGSKVTESCFELCRYASLINKVVIGGSGKLLSYFVNKNNPKKIITYADKRWTHNTDNLYTKLNFKYIHTSQPNYFWCLNKTRYHRYNFTKYKLVQKGKNPLQTETQIMHADGYYKIWDCGHLKYELIYNK